MNINFVMNIQRNRHRHRLEAAQFYYTSERSDVVNTQCAAIGGLAATFDKTLTESVVTDGQKADNKCASTKAGDEGLFKFRFMAFTFGDRTFAGMQHPIDYVNKCSRPYDASNPQAGHIEIRVYKEYKNNFAANQVQLKRVYDAITKAGFFVAPLEQTAYQGTTCAPTEGLNCCAGLTLGAANYKLFDLKDYSAAPGADAGARNAALFAAVEAVKSKTKVVAHCTGGTGRTGYMLAAMMMHEYYTKNKAQFQKDQKIKSVNNIKVSMVSADKSFSKKVTHDGYPAGLEVDADTAKIQTSVGSTTYDEHYEKKDYTLAKIVEMDGIIEVSGKYYVAAGKVNKVAEDIIKALRCAYKSSAVESASQVTSLSEFADFLAAKARRFQKIKKHHLVQKHIRKLTHRLRKY